MNVLRDASHKIEEMNGKLVCGSQESSLRLIILII